MTTFLAEDVTHRQVGRDASLDQTYVMSLQQCDQLHLQIKKTHFMADIQAFSISFMD